jgi:hypothetical protein
MMTQLFYSPTCGQPFEARVPRAPQGEGFFCDPHAEVARSALEASARGSHV